MLVCITLFPRKKSVAIIFDLENHCFSENQCETGMLTDCAMLRSPCVGWSTISNGFGVNSAYWSDRKMRNYYGNGYIHRSLSPRFLFTISAYSCPFPPRFLIESSRKPLSAGSFLLSPHSWRNSLHISKAFNFNSKSYLLIQPVAMEAKDKDIVEQF